MLVRDPDSSFVVPSTLTSGKHRVEQQHPSVGNILGQLVVEQSGLGGLLVSLDQNLANPYTPATLPQSLLH